MVLNVNREVSRGLRSPVLETKLVFRTGLSSLKHEDGLDAAPTADSSRQLSESEMTKSDADNLQQRYGEVMSEELNRLRHDGGTGIIKKSGSTLAISASYLSLVLHGVGAFIEVATEYCFEQRQNIIPCLHNPGAFITGSSLRFF